MLFKNFFLLFLISFTISNASVIFDADNFNNQTYKCEYVEIPDDDNYYIFDTEYYQDYTFNILIVRLSINNKSPSYCSEQCIEDIFWNNQYNIYNALNSQHLRIYKYFEKQDSTIISININMPTTECLPFVWVNEAYKYIVNPSRYMYKLYLIPKETSCTWAGLGTIGCNERYCFSFVNSAFPPLILHELGHNLGLHHATTDFNNDDIIDSEYGDLSSYMGSPASWTKYNAINNYILGFMPESNRLTLNIPTNNTLITINLKSSSINPIRGPIQLLILKDIENNINYWLSLRTFVQEPNYDFFLNNLYKNKVFIHKYNNRQTILIKILNIGESFLNNKIIFYGLIDNQTARIDVSNGKIISPPSTSVSKSSTKSLIPSKSKSTSKSLSSSVSKSISLTKTKSRTFSFTPSKTKSSSPSTNKSLTSSKTKTISLSKTKSRTFSLSTSKTKSVSRTFSLSLTKTKSITPTISRTFSLSASKTKSVSRTFSLSVSRTKSITPTISRTFSLSTSRSKTISRTFSLSASRSFSISTTNSPRTLTKTKTPLSLTRTSSKSISNSLSSSSSLSSSASSTSTRTPPRSRTPSKSISSSSSMSESASISSSSSISESSSISLSSSMSETSSSSMSETPSSSISESLSSSISESPSSSMSESSSSSMSETPSISLSSSMSETLSSSMSESLSSSMSESLSSSMSETPSFL
jgi:hypothetical protein